MSKKILSSTGKRIRALRNEKGWNQTEFVEILSGNGNQIARSSMSEIETIVTGLTSRFDSPSILKVKA